MRIDCAESIHVAIPDSTLNEAHKDYVLTVFAFADVTPVSLNEGTDFKFPMKVLSLIH